MASIKCNICRKTKTADDFLKNGKTLKSCLACRDKIKKKKLNEKDSDTKSVDTTVSDTISEKEIVSDNLIQNVVVSVPVPKINKPKLWYGLSGKWVKLGDEEKLHKMFMKKIIRELKKNAAFPIHKYLTKYIMVDIRDRYCSE
jgi:hypothetical protein